MLPKGLTYLFLSLALSLVTNASPGIIARHGSFVVHERRDTSAYTDTSLSRRLPADTPIPLRIGLKQQNLDLISTHLMAVSDPSSPSYGQHWSHEKVVETFKPPSEASDAVMAWLVNAGIDKARLKMSAGQSWIEVADAMVEEAERLLGTEYFVFKHESGDNHIACHEYSLPSSIAPHIDFVTPTVQPYARLNFAPAPASKFDQLRRRDIQQRSTAELVNNTPFGSLAGCDTAVVPNCLKTLYNMTYVPKATDRNTFAIVSRYPNIYLQSDLNTFFGNFSPALVGKSPTLVSIDGGNIETDENTSVGEDGWILQYAMSLTEPQPVQLLQVGNAQTGPIITFNEWLDAVDGSYCTSDGGDDFTFDPQLPNPRPGGLNMHSCGTVVAPNVASNSQADHEYRFPQFYLERQCNEFAKLGLMGVTVLYSSGNIGTSGTQSGYCLDDNGSMNLNGTQFIPSWPASCPWVTAVGGTQVKPSAAAATPSSGSGSANSSSSSNSGPEEVWNQDLTMGFFVSSGGGFSDRFLVPSYQKKAVEGYLDFMRKEDKATLKNFNVHGRAYPDISANANSFFNIDDGAVSIDSGTSGSTPTIGAIITLVNDARISAGKKPVGFINPTLYSGALQGAFNDIVDGTIQGCKGLQGQRDGGFKATKGWDAATGVGTPNLGRSADTLGSSKFFSSG